MPFLGVRVGVPGLMGGGGGAPYLGIVATRGNVPVAVNASLTAFMTRSMHYARDDMSKAAIVVPNFYVVGGGAGEVGPGAVTTVTASFEYPAGTFTRITFNNGSNSGTVPNGGLLVSDLVNVNIPRNAQFWVRMYLPNAAGAVYDGLGNQGSVANGDVCNNTDGDLTMSGTVSNGFAGYVTAPLAIIGMTRRTSVACIGTSRVAGVNDVQDASGDLGIVARSIGPNFAYVNLGVPSDTYASFISSHANRVAVAQYASHVIFEGPTNDDISVPATYQANLQTAWGYFPGKKVCAVTCDPITTGAWTLVNQTDQTVSKNFEASVNPYIRGLPAPLVRCFDIRTVTSTGVANKWNADGTPAKWTADGTHETQFANLQIAASSIFAPSLITR